MKTIKLFFIATAICSSNIYAQSLADAIKQTTNEQFETADATFKSLIQANPNNGEYYFYYGENYFKNDKQEMAKAMYQKGTDANATNPLCYVGLGKVQWYQGKQADAKANFYKATTLAAGKNAIVLMKIAEVYINAETKNLADAFALLEQAAKLEPKNPDVYILTGDAFLEQNNGTRAIDNYEKAAGLDPKSVKAILREGQLYNRSRNYPLSIDYYKKALLIDSMFAPAHRELGEIYFRAGQYKNSAAEYKKYLLINNDCSAREYYVQALNRIKQFQESIDEAKNVLMKCDSLSPNFIYLYRFLAYDYYEIKDYQNGLINANKFFSKRTQDVKLVEQDYENRGKLNAQVGNDSLAILDFKKAMELDTSRSDLNNDIAANYLKMRKYPEAINVFKKKVDAGKANANDYFGIGKAYYYSKDFANADSSFSQLIKLQPDLYLGYLWRAKANSQIDNKNEKWAAKPFYELFISKLKPEEMPRNKSYLIDAYNYLAAYYAKLKDCANTKLYLQKVLELEPSNESTKKILDGLKCK